MRFRGLTVMTNTPPRGAQSSPGGMQGIALMEPVLAKAARKLGIDQVAIRRINAPEGKAQVRAGGRRRQARLRDQRFIKEALDRGAEQFKWNERIARKPQAQRHQGARRRRFHELLRRRHRSASMGSDASSRTARLCFQSGIGNLGTESVIDVHRVAAEMLGVPWEKCDVAGATPPRTCRGAAFGRQPDHPRDDSRRAAVAEEAKKRLQEIAAKSLGGSPEDYEVGNERVFRKGGGAGMTLAQAAQKAIRWAAFTTATKLNPDVNKFTKESVAALAGRD